MSYYPNVKVGKKRCLNLSMLRRRTESSKTRRNPSKVSLLPKIDLLGSSTKVAHSIREGWENAVMYLAPHSRAEGANMCVMAGECKKGCLTSAGQLGMAPAEVSKIFKTRVYQADQNFFLNLLIADIVRFLNGLPTKKKNYIEDGKLPAKGGKLFATVRLNGTSDEPWEIIPLVIMPELIATLRRVRGTVYKDYIDPGLEEGKAYRNIFEVFPGLPFYDYTKYQIRARQRSYHKAYGNIPWPTNYHLTYSLNEQAASEKWAKEALSDGWSVAAVYNTLVKEVEAVRKLKAKLDPDDKAEVNRMRKIAQQGEIFPWQTIPGSMPIKGLGQIEVVNADVTDLRFLDGTDKKGRGKIAWLSAKGDAVRDCTGFVRDFATLESHDFGALINTYGPWSFLGDDLGCRKHSAEADWPISGVPTEESPLGSLTMKFPYRSWEEALVTGRPKHTRYKYDKKLTAKEKKEGKKPYPTGTVAPRFDWNRVLPFAKRGHCVYGGTLEGLIATVLTGAPMLYNGNLRMIESNKKKIAKSLIEEAAFTIGSYASSHGLNTTMVEGEGGNFDLFVHKPGVQCPPPGNWRKEFASGATRLSRASKLFGKGL